MLKAYVVAARLPRKNDKVQVIKHSECIPGFWEPITGADTEKEAMVLAERINREGGAMAWLDSRQRGWKRQKGEAIC